MYKCLYAGILGKQQYTLSDDVIYVSCKVNEGEGEGEGAGIIIVTRLYIFQGVQIPLERQAA